MNAEANLQALIRSAQDGTVPADRPSVVGARTFLRRFQPPETVIDGLPTPRGGVVLLTGPTGAGKTTLAAALQVAIVTGRPFAGREVTQGSVLVLAGENPDDYAMHLWATALQHGIPTDSLSGPAQEFNLWVVPGRFDVLRHLDHLDDTIAGTAHNLAAVFVDTSAAFFFGDDENDNTQMLRHASMLRELATLPGRPTVFALSHPTKSATRENLLPRGGGSFVAEVDVNLTLWKDASGVVTLHWFQKCRGQSFEPLKFELVPVDLPVTDCRGKTIGTTAVRHLPEDRAEALEVKALDDENRLLVAMQRKPGGSVADLAMAAGMTTGAGTPHKSRVHRLLLSLAADGLVSKTRGGTYALTGKGRKALEEVP